MWTTLRCERFAACWHSTAISGCFSCAELTTARGGLPGGGVEPGESWLPAAERECREETGWRVSVTGLYGVYSYPATQTHRYSDGRRAHFFGVVFLATLVEQVEDPDDEVAVSSSSP